MPSGGGSSGGAIVQQTNPLVAMQAGQLGSQAAYNASQLAQQQSYNALAQLQSSYASQLSALQPTTEEGIQAMDSLNQLLGLQAYTPSTAPTAPQSAQDWAKGQVTPAMLDQYVMANSVSNGFQAGPGQTQAYVYQGVGSQGQQWGGEGTRMSPQALLNDSPGINQAITQSLTDQLAHQYQPVYDAQNQVYNQQMGLYNYANQQAANYPALTGQQISDKLAQTPGYQFNLQQGTNAIQNMASKSGNAMSGNMLQGLVDYASGLAQQTYGTQVQNLANLVNAGNQANMATANAAGNLGSNAASVYNNLGTTQANSALSEGNSLIQGLLAGNQEYNVMGGGSSGSSLGGIGSLVGGLLGSPTSSGGSLISGLFGL